MHSIRLLNVEQHEMSDYPVAVGWTDTFPTEKNIQEWVEMKIKKRVTLKHISTTSIKTVWNVYSGHEGHIGKVIRFKDENLK